MCAGREEVLTRTVRKVGGGESSAMKVKKPFQEQVVTCHGTELLNDTKLGEKIFFANLQVIADENKNQ